MTPLPSRSPGVLLSGPLTAVAHDLVAAVLHRLNPTGHELLAACDGLMDRDELLFAWADRAGVASAVIEGDVTAALESFAHLGLVGRTDPPPVARILGDAADARQRAYRGTMHPVGGRAVQFTGDDPALIDLVDGHLGPGVDDVEPTWRFTVDEREGGSIQLVADSEWVFTDRESLLNQITTVVNEYGHAVADTVVLHAAGVVAPDGRIVVLPAPSGAGKSTLAGHLVAAGWGYLGDESIAIRAGDLAALPYPKPLALDSVSREVLDLPASPRWNTEPTELRPGVNVHVTTPGPAELVVLPTFQAGADLVAERLDPGDALVDLVANALNLLATGQAGLDTLDAVATSVPVHRVVHGDAREVERWLLELGAEPDDRPPATA